RTGARPSASAPWQVAHWHLRNSLGPSDAGAPPTFIEPSPPWQRVGSRTAIKRTRREWLIPPYSARHNRTWRPRAALNRSAAARPGREQGQGDGGAGGLPPHGALGQLAALARLAAPVLDGEVDGGDEGGEGEERADGGPGEGEVVHARRDRGGLLGEQLHLCQ